MSAMLSFCTLSYTGADPGFQVREGALKKLHRAEGGTKFWGYFVWKITILRQKIIFFSIAEGGAKIFEVFRVKNHDFTQKNHIFFNCRGRRENFWGISCEKSRFYAKKKNHIFSNFRGGGRAPGAPPPPPPESAPAIYCLSFDLRLLITHILLQNFPCRLFLM